jgi:hypothetical protein
METNTSAHPQIGATLVLSDAAVWSFPWFISHYDYLIAVPHGGSTDHLIAPLPNCTGESFVFCMW